MHVDIRQKPSQYCNYPLIKKKTTLSSYHLSAIGLSVWSGDDCHVLIRLHGVVWVLLLETASGPFPNPPNNAELHDIFEQIPFMLQLFRVDSIICDQEL